MAGTITLANIRFDMFEKNLRNLFPPKNLFSAKMEDAPITDETLNKLSTIANALGAVKVITDFSFHTPGDENRFMPERNVSVIFENGVWSKATQQIIQELTSDTPHPEDTWENQPDIWLIEQASYYGSVQGMSRYEIIALLIEQWGDDFPENCPTYLARKYPMGCPICSKIYNAEDCSCCVGYCSTQSSSWSKEDHDEMYEN